MCLISFIKIHESLQGEKAYTTFFLQSPKDSENNLQDPPLCISLQ